MTSSFDYIVVGSGSAGAVIGSRLSEDKGTSVLLLEAGKENHHPFQLMPIAFIRLAANRLLNWGYDSEPEPELGWRTLAIPRGKTLGGSSAINAMIAIRGNARDYDLWCQQGLVGWGYDDVLPYFKKLENNWRGASDYHGAGGPVDVSPIDFPDMYFDVLAQAATATGIPLNSDPNGAVQDGISRMEATISSGRRASTASAYLYPAMARSNLIVKTGARAARVLIEHGRAVGVEYVQEGRVLKALAHREVVLSGGAYNSPQLLMLSGIGPADHLRSVGVIPIHDLPGVGQNLAEHPNILNVYRARQKQGLTRFLRLDQAALQTSRWYLRHDGPFATNGATANIFLRTRPGLDRPDVQIINIAISNAAKLWFPALTAKPAYCFSARIGALHPQSRGWVKLRSLNPNDAPRIFFNMFSVRDDLDTMVRALRLSREIYRQSPQADIIDSEIFPGSKIVSDEALAQVIRENAGHRSHPVGTCRMGLDSDAVVDAELKVRGIEGLRVADASVMPDLPSGNTNLPTIMIGEKAADMIRGRCLAPFEIPGESGVP